MLGMEVPGSNSGKFFFDILIHLFNPMVTALLEYANPTILHSFGLLCRCNSKPPKGTATMISLCTHQLIGWDRQLKLLLSQGAVASRLLKNLYIHIIQYYILYSRGW